MAEALFAHGRAFVLVHGAWHGGWCYSRVAQILRTRGHQVFTPTLTGVGERSHLADCNVNCSTHIRDVVNLIQWERLSEVVLCGHSYAGMVIGAVADAIPNRIDALVYLDSPIPENGKSLFDLIGARDQVAYVLQATADNGGRLVPPFPAASFNMNSADQVMVDALSTPQPLATFCERLTLGGAYMNVRKKVFVLASGWAPSVADEMYARVKDDPSWTTFEVPCGHDVMLDAPERLAEILLGV